MNNPKKKSLKQCHLHHHKKYFGIILMNLVEDPYSENDKSLLKEINEDAGKWEDIPCSWTGRLSSLKMSDLPKVIYRFSISPVKIPMKSFLQKWKNPS